MFYLDFERVLHSRLNQVYIGNLKNFNFDNINVRSGILTILMERWEPVTSPFPLGKLALVASLRLLSSITPIWSDRR